MWFRLHFRRFNLNHINFEILEAIENAREISSRVLYFEKLARIGTISCLHGWSSFYQLVFIVTIRKLKLADKRVKTIKKLLISLSFKGCTFAENEF